MPIKMFGFVSGASLRESARLLVDGLGKAVSQASSTKRNRQAKDKLAYIPIAESALNGLFMATAEVCRKYRLGIIGRARLAKALQAELLAKGYDANAVSKITSAVIMNALVASPSPSNK